MAKFPPQSTYPLAIDSNRTLFLVYNTSETKLAIDNSAWSEEIEIIPVNFDQNEIWAENGFANISGELFYYDSVEKNSEGKIFKFKNCARNIGGKKTKFNPAGTWVRGFVIAEHHNQLADTVINIENYIFDLEDEIIKLEEQPFCLDDIKCPEVVLETSLQQSSDNCEGITINYTIIINGSYNNFRLDFGDGDFTTSPANGSHVYPPNTTIDPVVTISNEQCTVVQTPIERNNSTIPEEIVEIPNLEITLPPPPEFPDITIPDCPEIPFDFDIPQLIIPQINLTSVVPNFSINIPDINIPPQINFVPPISIPPQINFGPAPFIPVEINFGDFDVDFDFNGNINFGPAPLVDYNATINFEPAPLVDYNATIEFVGEIPSFNGFVEFGPAPIRDYNGRVTFDTPPIVDYNGTVTFGTAPIVDYNGTVFFGPAPTIPDIKIEPPNIPDIKIEAPNIPDIKINVNFPDVKFEDVNFPDVKFEDVNFPDVEFGPAPYIPEQITITGPNPYIPSQITITGPYIPEHISIGTFPAIPDIKFEDPPTIDVEWGSAPTIDVEFPDPLPKIGIEWGEVPTITVEICCPSGGTSFARKNYFENEDFEDDFSNIQLEINNEDIGIPSEIQIVAPKEFPQIEMVHNLPESIPIISTLPEKIEVFQKSSILHSHEVKIINENIIPKTIDIRSEGIPKTIYLDSSSLPVSISLDVPEIPAIKIDASEIPDSIKVVGIPDTIEIKMPDEIIAKLEIPENLEVPLVYKGGPIPIQFDNTNLGDGNGPCFTLVPCDPKK